MMKCFQKFAVFRPARAFSTFGEPPRVIQRRVVVTGMGVVTPLATGVDLTWQRLLAKHSGLRALRVEDLKVGGEQSNDELLEMLAQMPSKVVAGVCYGSDEGEFNPELWFQGKDARSLSPFIAYALCAAEEALSDAKWHPQGSQDLEKTGVSVGGGIGCISEITEASGLLLQKRLRRLSPFFVPRILINMAAGHISMKYGFRGPNHAVVTACASGAHSIGDAYRMVSFGDADVMVAGGTECSIDALSIAGFSRLKALSTKFNDEPERASRPFDANRDGFVIGEGAGVMVLEELEHARCRGAKIYGEIRGYGMSGDAHHITQPSEDGRGAFLAMQRALVQAGLKPEQVDYINAHATSTPLGDAVEAKAIKELFGQHATSDHLALSSTKGATGHLLGAAGAVEAVFSVLALHHGIAPPTLNIDKPDALFHEHFLPLVSPTRKPIHVVLSNSFGFGGTNSSLVFTGIS
ncbi:hypothetical protein KP509_13G001700 [Ceratopteris richardii]|uniref:3-oxoacyl-[acyl-carrier-protein] synthase n=1 Tax=Ceratopteris richardii TaxID=49495 RepID=A0A8T2TAT9_CERRI|nr:hypothetical protein KP509_13G001700 [Ceratopteris richardii]